MCSATGMLPPFAEFVRKHATVTPTHHLRYAPDEVSSSSAFGSYSPCPVVAHHNDVRTFQNRSILSPTPTPLTPFLHRLRPSPYRHSVPYPRKAPQECSSNENGSNAIVLRTGISHYRTKLAKQWKIGSNSTFSILIPTWPRRNHVPNHSTFPSRKSSTSSTICEPGIGIQVRFRNVYAVAVSRMPSTFTRNMPGTTSDPPALALPHTVAQIRVSQ